MLAALVHPALAGDRVLTLAPESTTISFTLGATMHDVHGTVGLARGTVHFAEIPGPATGEVVIDARTAETGNAKRDRKMHREVLESESHSEIVLSVTRLEGELPQEGEGPLALHGRLGLHGGEHDVVLDLRVTVTGAEVQAVGELRVPYVEWGLEDPSAFVLRVAKHVDVKVEARGSLGEAADPESGAVTAP